MPTPDPWLTDEGDVVPALDWAGMPEWEDVDLGLRLILARAEHSWTIKERDKSPRAFYCYDQHTTPYEAHAIIENWLREWLLERGWKVMWSFRRQVYVIFERVSGQGYFREDLGSFETEPAALQAAVMESEP